MADAGEAIQALDVQPLLILSGFRELEAIEKVEGCIEQIEASLREHGAEEFAEDELLDAPAADNRPLHVSYLPPDIDYYLDCSQELGHISADTAFFVRHIHPDPIALIENKMKRPQDVPGRWTTYLRGRDLHLEEAYIAWRRDNRELGRAVSMSMRYSAKFAIDHLIEESVGSIVFSGYMKFTPITALSLPSHFKENMDVLRRGIGRMNADLAGLTDADVKELNALALSLRRSTPAAPRVEKEKHIPRWLKKKRRNILKRSIEALSSLLGREPVRIFLGMQELYVEGRLCNYKIKREKCDLTGVDDMSSHGAARLTLLRKGDAAHIANMCIYTKDVPLLDHVANLVLHIRGGLEDELLKIGNFYSTDYDVLETIPELAAFTTPRRKKTNKLRVNDGVEDNDDQRSVYRNLVGRGRCQMLGLGIMGRMCTEDNPSAVRRDEYQPGDENIKVAITDEELGRRRELLKPQMFDALIPASWKNNPIYGDWYSDRERGLLATS